MLLTARKRQCRYRVSGSCSRESAPGLLPGIDPVLSPFPYYGIANIQIRGFTEALLMYTLSTLESDSHGLYATSYVLTIITSTIPCPYRVSGSYTRGSALEILQGIDPVLYPFR